MESRIGIDIDNLDFVEQLYESWKTDPDSVPDDWASIFESFAANGGMSVSKAAARYAASVAVPTTTTTGVPAGAPAAAPATVRDYTQTYVYKQGRVDSLVWAYRDVGYLYANLNPLHGYLPPELEYLAKTVEGAYGSLEPQSFGLTEEDLDTEFRSGRNLTPAKGTLREILASLKATYCGPIGTEILHIQNKAMRGWVIEKLEEDNNSPRLSGDKKKRVLTDLIKAEEFERFIHSNYIGRKRFSLEGSESLIPALHQIIDSAANELGVQEIVMGMAHRGRLNVLTNLMHKPEEEIFSTFEEKVLPHEVGGSGDVKYHLGFSTDHEHEDGSKVHVSLPPNPSHLEAVDPVVQGKARAQQRRREDTQRKKVLPVLVHGDSAFTGQGIVAETFNLSQLRGYKTGGTVHIIVNNQIGFTTSARDTRSTFFCTDVAKSMPVPIFHVNGDHPEHVIRVIDLAVRFRQKFGYDAVVDIVCYRKYGHNEADDPSFTHPIMYRLIEKAESVAEKYGRQLESEGVIDEEDREKIREEYRQRLKDALESARNEPVAYKPDGFEHGAWKGYTREYDNSPVDTTVDSEKLRFIGEHLVSGPKGFGIHKKLRRILDEKKKMFASGEGFDWATAEALSFGSLLLEGFPVRLSGEDSGRGTFSQRHAVWWNTDSAEPEPYVPLANLSEDQARFRVYDSPLSEYSVLGFEYGYAMTDPGMLTLWEAQFGDFANGAQVIIDQFVAAGEAKWNRGNGLVMLLPHGYAGQGPEHSYGHLSRFLQLAAQDNIQVCNLTTPAQYFHLLRRQMRRRFRKPLIIMSPKSLLRSKEAVSTLEDLAACGFCEVIDDPAGYREAETVLLCSGKVYYDLNRRRVEEERSDTAIVRLEQLYPLPEERIAAVLGAYKKAKRHLWVQEEPRNRGGWYFINEHRRRIVDTIEYVGRPGSASPATGSYKQHQLELETILKQVFQ